MVAAFRFDNTYEKLPDRFYASVSPAKVSAPRVIKVNRALAELLGLDADELASETGAAILSGNIIPDGAKPIALAYAGHQFGGFVRQLGDGRAILLGEVVGTDGIRRDIQLKGAGRTPFSRGGDGRAALGPVLREYVVSEAMAALGIPTTRSLAAVTTGEPVARDTLLPGAILTRVARSHLRVGTFEFFAARGDEPALKELVAYAIDRHYPDAKGSANDALALLDRVIDGQASLVARWLGVGFIHGVMNTDNTSIAGETIDYGPCAFLDEYDPRKKFSSIDMAGRYAYMNQPRIAGWNMARFAETLLPLVADDEEEAVRLATEHLQRFEPAFQEAYTRVLRAKLGFLTEGENDRAIADDLLSRMAESEVDFTLLFRALAASAEDPKADEKTASLFVHQGAFYDWAETWRKRIALEESACTPAERAAAMRRASPALIPRNHRNEEMITAAVAHEDYAPFESLVNALAHPYDEPSPADAHLLEPPKPDERVRATFCGT
jgi:serine/tyrosine/threonine adenylyltransferase